MKKIFLWKKFLPGTATLLLWLRIIRPQTLFASACPVVAALLLTGVSDGLVAAATLLCSLALQILSNLINDYYDYRRGTDKKARVGFRRALAEGEVSEKEMKTACLSALSVCVLLGAFLIFAGGWPILLIGVTALLFAWLYTATRYSLSYLGIADIFVLLYFGIAPAVGTALLQGVLPSRPIIFAGATSGVISMWVLMLNNLRDREADLQVGKRTLPVRNKIFALGLIPTFAFAIPAFSYLAFGRPLLPGVLGLGICVLLYFTFKAKGPQYNRCLVAAGLLNALFVLLAALA